MGVILRAGLVIALGLLPGLLFAEEGAGGMLLEAAVDGGKLKLKTREAPLERVLLAVAGISGEPLHYSAVPSRRVTADCRGESARQLLECLLGSGADLLVRTGQDGKPGVWILGSSFAAAGKPADTNGSASSKESAECAAAQTPPPQDNGELLQQAQAEDPAQRADAIARLAAPGKALDADAHAALLTALGDESAEVRAQALFGLARNDAPAAAPMLREALRDGDASVRLMAVDSAGGDAAGVALLQSALADSDATVRELAAMKLKPLLK
jgi:hypothetical protein